MNLTKRVGGAHCRHPITDELKITKTKTGERKYAYYRCAKYNTSGHPRVRVTEADLDAQVLSMFEKMKIADEKVLNWFNRALHAMAKDSQMASQARLTDLTRQISTVTQQ